MDFLDDIESDRHQLLLEKGNLLPKKREVSWSDENSWISQGYIARVLVTRCQCGTALKQLFSLAHCERTPSGKSREQALKLNQKGLTFPQSTRNQILVTTSDVEICAECVIAHNFTL